MASSGCAFSFAVRAARVEALACWFEKHAWVEGGGRESPRRARYFSLLRQRKVPKRKATPSLRPLRGAKGQTCGGAVAGCAVELTALRCSFVQTSTASQSTKHGRCDAHATPQPPRRRRSQQGWDSRTAEQPNSQHPSGPLLRSASFCGRKRHALRKLGRAKQRPVWLFGSLCPSGCAEERRVWRIRARDCLSEVKRSEFERDPAKPEHRRLPRSEAQGTQTVGSPFFWVLFFGEAKKSASPAGRLPASALGQGMLPNQRTQPETTKTIAASAYPTSASSQKHPQTTRRAHP